MGLSAPSGSKAAGAFPLTLACARFAPSSPGGLGCGDTPLAVLPSEGCPHVLSSASPAQIACNYRGSRPSASKAAEASPLKLASLAISRSLHADRPFAPGIEPNVANSGI